MSENLSVVYDKIHSDSSSGGEYILKDCCRYKCINYADFLKYQLFQKQNIFPSNDETANSNSTHSYVENELLIHGNTNRIADSGFTTGQQIFAIGDSHCIFWHKSMKIKNHWLYGMPVTIYSLFNEGLDIYNIGTNLENNQGMFGKGHSMYNIKKNDFVILYFGSNDMQRNIKLHAAERWMEEIENLINKYIHIILHFRRDYGIIPIVSNIYPNPIVGADGQNTVGSVEERTKYILYANNLLKDLCFKNKILFFDTYSLIADEDNFVRKEFSVDNTHLDHTNHDLCHFIEKEIVEFCENNL
jgi:hypothetical protein